MSQNWICGARIPIDTHTACLNKGKDSALLKASMPSYLWNSHSSRWPGSASTDIASADYSQQATQSSRDCPTQPSRVTLYAPEEMVYDKNELETLSVLVYMREYVCSWRDECNWYKSPKPEGPGEDGQVRRRYDHGGYCS